MQLSVLLLLAAALHIGWCGLNSTSLQGTSLQGYWRQIFTLNEINFKSPLQEYSAISTPMDCSRKCLNHELCVVFILNKSSEKCRVYKHYAWAGFPWTGYTTYWKIHEQCLSEYTLMAGLCLKAYNLPESWDIAEQTCTQDGGHLYIMDSELRKDTLTQHLTKQGNLTKAYYLGGMRKTSKYIWLNGAEVINFWSVNATKKEDNILGHYQSGAIQVFDSSGTSSENFVCELPILNP